MDKKISVILPVFNAEAYLKKAIESILNQTYADFELIIINDGSLDHSEEIILSFNDNRIIYVKNSKNMGVVASLNAALKIATCKYIARMDADDIAYSHRLKTQYDYMELHPEIGVCGSYLEILATKELIKYPQFHEEIVFDFLIRNVIAHPVVMFKRELLNENNLQYQHEYYPAEDYKLWLDLIKVTTFYNFPFPLLQYNVHPSSISQSNQQIQIEKIYEIRTTYLLDTLLLYTEDSFQLMMQVLKFQIINDPKKIDKLKILFVSLLEKNVIAKSFNHEKFLQLFRLYWYIVVKQSNANMGTTIKTYLSLRHIGLCKLYFFFKLLLTSMKYEKTAV